MLDNIIKKVDKINYNKLKGYQKSEYFNLKNRIEWLLTLQFFLSLRQKIKKEVTENYLNKTTEEIINLVVTYDGYGSIEYKGIYIWESDLQPLIEEYVKQQIQKIENHTLKLELCTSIKTDNQTEHFKDWQNIKLFLPKINHKN